MDLSTQDIQFGKMTAFNPKPPIKAQNTYTTPLNMHSRGINPCTNKFGYTIGRKPMPDFNAYNPRPIGGYYTPEKNGIKVMQIQPVQPYYH